ncbi:MAG TPA: hypothetical protein VMW24_07525 [Sedimentisphaerales bacterium]|nr:hypothetical protein [Sedimentisphaerales bacterium]
MTERISLKTRYLHVIWAVLIFAFLLLLMAILECEMAAPAY